MVPAGNKAKRLSSVNHTIKTIHHHHQFISKSSVRRLNKKKNLHCYKRLKTPQVNSTCRKRRVERAEKLLQRFSIHSLPRLVFQDKKDLSLQSPIIAKTIEFISMVSRKMCNWNVCTGRKQIFEKGYCIHCDNLERC